MSARLTTNSDEAGMPLFARLVAGLAAAALTSAPALASEEQYGPVAEPEETSAAEAIPQTLPQPLLDAIATSLDQSPLVLAGLADVAALESDLRTARWQRYPSLTADILATTGGSNIADADGLAVNLALEQPIWAGGGIGSQIDAARFNRDVGINALREIRFQILFAVVQSYFDVLLALEQSRALEAGLEDHRRLVASIERRVAQEVSPQADLTLARSRLTQMEVELTTAQELGENAMLRLQEFVGEEIDMPVFPEAAIFDDVPAEGLAVQDMMTCSPSIDRLRSEIDVAEAQVRTTRSSLFPQLLLQLSQNELTGTRAAIVLRAQTGNGLSRLSALDSAKSRVDQSVAELGQADREGRTRLRSEYVALRSNQQREEAGKLASEAATDLLASYQRQFVAGRRSWLDVLNAAREVTSARISEANARVGASANATRILALSCRWRPAGV